MCFTRPPSRNSSCGVHLHMGIELPSPVKDNTLQAKHLRRRTHQPIILRFAGAECPLQYVLTVLPPSISAQPEKTLPGWDAACMVRITPGFDSCNTLLPLEQPNQPRTHSEKTSQSLQLHYIQVRRLLHLACQIPALDL